MKNYQKSLGKRNSNVESLNTALVHIFDQAITLVVKINLILKLKKGRD